jgi:HSP20 family molecular chaperone IbpA
MTIKLRKYEPMWSVKTDVWDFFDDWFTMGDWFSTGLSRYRYVPLSESYVKDHRLHIRMELPGVDMKDVDVSVHDSHLRISGIRKAPDGVGDADFCFDEMSYGSFERCFHIPRAAQNDKIHAKLDSGMLDLTIPLDESHLTTKIPIQGVGKGKGKTIKSAS